MANGARSHGLCAPISVKQDECQMGLGKNEDLTIKKAKQKQKQKKEEVQFVLSTFATVS